MHTNAFSRSQIKQIAKAAGLDKRTGAEFKRSLLELGKAAKKGGEAKAEADYMVRQIFDSLSNGQKLAIVNRSALALAKKERIAHKALETSIALGGIATLTAIAVSPGPERHSPNAGNKVFAIALGVWAAATGMLYGAYRLAKRSETKAKNLDDSISRNMQAVALISEIRSGIYKVEIETLFRQTGDPEEKSNRELNSVLHLYKNGYPYMAEVKADELVKTIEGLKAQIKELAQLGHDQSKDVKSLQEDCSRIAARLDEIVSKQGKI